jgi:hypothetical protein
LARRRPCRFGSRGRGEARDALLLHHDYTSDDDSMHGGVVHNGNLWLRGEMPPMPPAGARAEQLLTHSKQGQAHQPRALSAHDGSDSRTATDSARSSPQHGSRSTEEAGQYDGLPASPSWRSSPSIHIPSPGKAALLPRVPSPEPVPARQAQPEPPSPVLGTWAQRQFKLPLPSQQGQRKANPFAAAAAHSAVLEDGGAAGGAALPRPAAADGQQRASGSRRASAGPSAAAAGAQAAAAVPVAAPSGGGGSAWRGASTDSEDEAQQDAAWRWRFQRRWRMEQARLVDPAQASKGAPPLRRRCCRRRRRLPGVAAALHPAPPRLAPGAAGSSWARRRAGPPLRPPTPSPHPLAATMRPHPAGGDHMEEAIAYLNACGEGWVRHLARTASTDTGSRAMAGTLVSGRGRGRWRWRGQAPAHCCCSCSCPALWARRWRANAAAAAAAAAAAPRQVHAEAVKQCS